jgi:hypothetical protein
MQYNTQLHHKALHIEQLLQRVGKFSCEAVQAARLEPAAAADGRQYGYRNKVQLAFSSRVWVEDGAAGDGHAAVDRHAFEAVGAAGGVPASAGAAATAAAAAATAAGAAVGAAGDRHVAVVEGAGAAAAAAAGAEVGAAGVALQDDTNAAAAAAAGVLRAGRVVDGWGLGFYLPGSNAVVMPVRECSLVVSRHALCSNMLF